MVFVEENKNLSHLNTFGVEAVCSRFVTFTSLQDMDEVRELSAGRRRMVIGRGSNILFTEDFDGVILYSNLIDLAVQETDDEVLISAGSGITMDIFIEAVCRKGLWGLENLSLIPGTVGASAVQNIGAYGVEASDCITQVECYDLLNACFVTLTRSECTFGYRNSFFKKHQGRYIITHVTFRLTKEGKPCLDYGNKLRDIAKSDVRLTPMSMRNLIISMRNEKLPAVERYGSAGSFFKNVVLTLDEYNIVNEKYKKEREAHQNIPFFQHGDGKVKIPSAWLIEKCGFKGFACGNVAVWKNQPLVLVNLTGKASAQEIMNLAHMIEEKVENVFSLRLQREVEYI